MSGTVLAEGELSAYDAAIAAGQLPPVIIAIPDGTQRGSSTLFGVNPFWVNSRAGNYEDYLMRDVWSFSLANYSIRPERSRTLWAAFPAGAGPPFAWPSGIAKCSVDRHPPALQPALAGLPRAYRCRLVRPRLLGLRTDLSRGARNPWPVRRRGGHPGATVGLPAVRQGTGTLTRLSWENPIEMLDAYAVWGSVGDVRRLRRRATSTTAHLRRWVAFLEPGAAAWPGSGGRVRPGRRAQLGGGAWSAAGDLGVAGAAAGAVRPDRRRCRGAGGSDQPGAGYSREVEDRPTG